MRPRWSWVAALPEAVAVAVVASERRWPLRRQTGDPRRRLLASAGVGLPAFPVTALLEKPVPSGSPGPLARGAGSPEPGPSPPVAGRCGALALLDYGLYLWHILLHERPLWRFHAVHHLDRDRDVSTALRFHAGELLASLP